MLRKRMAERLPERIDGIRLRGRDEVSRIEGLSDAVFGFAITLLIVSLEVPKTLDELLAAMAGFVPFAISFWLLASIWHRQFRFFRTYGLQDDVTAWLNIALLFVVLFYTYPLKFLFGAMFRDDAAALPAERLWQLWIVYGAGWTAMYVIFVALNLNALRLRAQLELDDLELFGTREHVWVNLALVGVGTFVVAFALAGGPGLGRWAGYGFFAIPVLMIGLKSTFGRERRRRYGDSYVTSGPSGSVDASGGADGTGGGGSGGSGERSIAG